MGFSVLVESQLLTKRLCIGSHLTGAGPTGLERGMLTDTNRRHAGILRIN